MEEYRCFICSKKINSWDQDLTPLTGPDSAVLFKGYAGYGSNHDLLDMTILICDACITKYKHNIVEVKLREF
jgi:hypothetical protein